MKDELHNINEENNCPDLDPFGQNFQCGDGSANWRVVTIDLEHLTQRGYGKKQVWNPAQAIQMQFVTSATLPTGFQCDYRILRLEQ